MKHKIKWLINNVDVIQYLKYNYFAKNVVRSKDTFIYPMKGAKLDVNSTAKLELNGDLYVGANLFRGSKRETYLMLNDNAKLVIEDETKFNYGCFVQVHKNALMTIGGAIINTDSVIIAQKEIRMGKDVIMGRMVTIFDSDFHPIYDDEGNRTNPARKVEIGNHVWIGIKATVLKGAKIKEGAVISANALVAGIVKANTMYSALPGQSFGSVDWGARKK